MDGNLIKIASKITLPALLQFVSGSRNGATFCDRWKFHVVFPHHKKWDRMLASNYRPVCHLIEVGQVGELVVWYQLQEHCTKHDIIPNSHHGSNQHQNCITALGQLQDTATQAGDLKKLTAIIMLYQTAAYDLMVHSLLLRNI